ncbi:MAG: hypothetical protein MRY59_00470 [Aquisalinus sp.]|nr:hypothetical protein [Aquisalinus sp.]
MPGEAEMYVTAEERQPLGGGVSFLLPMLAAGTGTGLAVGLSLPEVVTTVLVIVGLNFLYLWRASKPVSSLIAAVAVAMVVTVSLHFAGVGWLVILAWICLLAFEGAATDNPDAFWSVPSWRAIFARLSSLPIMIAVVAFLAGLLFLMLTAVFQASLTLGDTRLGGDAMLQTLAEQWNRLALAMAGFILAGLVALVRSQRALVGAVRYAVMLAGRYLLPVLSVISLAFLVSAIGNPVYTQETRTAGVMMFAITLLVTIILVYADGSSRLPPLWIQLSLWLSGLTLACLATVLAAGLFGSASGDETVVTSDQSPISVMIIVLATLGLMVSLMSGLFYRQSRWLPLLPHLNRVLVLIVGFAPLMSLLF